MFENIRLSFQGIWSHKMRSFLTMLGIIIGIAAIIAIVSTIKGTNEQIKENLIGILVGTFKKAEAFIRPLCEFVRYMPVPAFVPLIMVWVGIEESAKITVIFIGTFFQLVLMVADDALAVPDDLINAGYTLGSNTPKTIFKILIPAMMPRLMETLRMMIGWAWTYLVSAELVAANTGLGYTILKSQRFLKTDAIFANIILIGLLGLITDRIFAFLNKKLFPWAAA